MIWSSLDEIFSPPGYWRNLLEIELYFKRIKKLLQSKKYYKYNYVQINYKKWYFR